MNEDFLELKEDMDKSLKDNLKLYRAMRNAKDYCNTTALSFEDVARGLKELGKFKIKLQ